MAQDQKDSGPPASPGGDSGKITVLDIMLHILAKAGIPVETSPYGLLIQVSTDVYRILYQGDLDGNTVVLCWARSLSLEDEGFADRLVETMHYCMSHIGCSEDCSKTCPADPYPGDCLMFRRW